MCPSGAVRPFFISDGVGCRNAVEKGRRLEVKKQAIIIGAGPAGLTAALELLRQAADTYEVTVLEECETVGGISKTVEHHGNRMDMGGHRFFSKDPRVTAWWEALLPTQGAPSLDDRLLEREKPWNQGGPDPEQEDTVMLLRDRVSRIYYGRRFFDYPISMKKETIRNMGFGTTVKAGCSYIKASLFKRRENSLEDFYINRFGRVLYAMFFEGYTEKLWGRHPREISAEWGAQRVKGLSITAILKDMLSKLFGKKKTSKKVETSLIEAFLYPKYGPGQLWETAAAQIRLLGGTIRCGCKVTAIKTQGQTITAVCCEQNGQSAEIAADVVFSSMAVKDLVAGIEPPPPHEMQRIADGLPYRDFITIGLLVKKINLKNETPIKTLGNIVPDCWIYVQDAGVKLGRIQIFNNWSPYMVSDPQRYVWMGLEYFCTEGDAFWNMSEEDCVAQAVRELQTMGVLADDAEVLDSHREKVKKAYPAYFDTYAEMDRLQAYLNTFDNLYCIGRNGQHRYNNMDHSMVTAFEAVRLLLTDALDKTPMWQVNTEKEYHEEKSAE